MSAHTPGPWLVHECLVYALHHEGDFHKSKPLMVNRFWTSVQGRIAPGELEANARLIAAAPDLLAALRFILAFYEPGQTYLDTEAWKVAEASARAAVAKAEGAA